MRVTKHKSKNLVLKHTMTDAQKTIIEEVCKYMGIELKDIYTKSRRADLVVGRYIIFYLFTQYLKCSMIECAFIFRKDHTTVSTGLVTFLNDMDQSEEYRARYYAIKNILLEKGAIKELY